MMNRNMVYLVIALIVLVPHMIMAEEEGRLKFGNFKVVPGLTVLGESNDNIYEGNGENETTELEESDWITHAKPQLGLQQIIPDRGAIVLGYKGDFAYYSDYSDNDWVSNTGMLDFDYITPRGLFVDFSMVYTETEDPYGSDNEYKSGIPLTDRSTNRIKCKTGFVHEEISKVLLLYNFYKQDYKNNLLDYSQDYEEKEFGFGVEMNVATKTWAFLRWYRGYRDYFTHLDPEDETLDSDYHWQKIVFGFTWDSGARFSGEMNFGYKWLDYDVNDSGIELQSLIPRQDRYKNKDNWVAATSVTYHVNAGTDLTLEIANDIKPVGSDSNNYYEDTRVGLGFSHLMFQRLKLAASVAYSCADYRLNRRKDDNYIGTFNADLQILHWLKAGVGYSYKQKESSSNNALDNYGKNNEYEVNRYFVNISAVF